MDLKDKNENKEKIYETWKLPRGAEVLVEGEKLIFRKMDGMYGQFFKGDKMYIFLGKFRKIGDNKFELI